MHNKPDVAALVCILFCSFQQGCLASSRLWWPQYRLQVFILKTVLRWCNTMSVFYLVENKGPSAFTCTVSRKTTGRLSKYTPRDVMWASSDWICNLKPFSSLLSNWWPASQPVPGYGTPLRHHHGNLLCDQVWLGSTNILLGLQTCTSQPGAITATRKRIFPHLKIRYTFRICMNIKSCCIVLRRLGSPSCGWSTCSSHGWRCWWGAGCSMCNTLPTQSCAEDMSARMPSWVLCFF